MMRLLRRLGPCLAFSLLAACGDSSGSGAPPLSLTFTSAPIDLAGISAKYAQDVPYGGGERNLFDIYLPDCEGPTPLVIYIHGGGFTGGDKDSADADLVREFLGSCVAHAAVNYILLDVPSQEEGTASAVAQGGVLSSMTDAARALQFMRYYATSLNIDPENVALYGGSAGAGTRLWLGTHDDMADPSNPDPVLRQSTRVKAVGAIAPQSTYDLLEWEQILLPVTGPLEPILGATDVPSLAELLGATNYLLTFLGVGSVANIYSAENVAYRENIDMLALMDASDAPIFVHSFDTSFGDPLDMFLHHALHGLAIKSRADEVGLESVAYSDEPDYPRTDPSGERLASFLIRHIQ